MVRLCKIMHQYSFCVATSTENCEHEIVSTDRRVGFDLFLNYQGSCHMALKKFRHESLESSQIQGFELSV